MNGVLPRGYNALSENSPVVTAVCVFIFLYDLLFVWSTVYVSKNRFKLQKMNRYLFYSRKLV